MKMSKILIISAFSIAVCGAFATKLQANKVGEVLRWEGNGGCVNCINPGCGLTGAVICTSLGYRVYDDTHCATQMYYNH
jgi:hypothetical protein